METVDPIITETVWLKGTLRIHQDRRGYQFSTDTLALVAFLKTLKGARLLELGSGCGVLLLFLSRLTEIPFLCGVEIQSALCQLATQNIMNNGLEQKIQLLQANFTKGQLPLVPQSFDMVVTNPPYYKVTAGRLNPNPQKAIARHEIQCNLADIIETVKYCLVPQGRFVIIYPVIRLGELLSQLETNHLHPEQIQLFYPARDSNAVFGIVLATLGGKKELLIRPPIISQESFKELE